ncbi:hypothetical protein [Ethanoligenens sp.]|uniref:hypothetical protein n=1 Tax=Ethanoligenens sp. TaxID=2099655 RepID=UPI0039E92834
MDLLNIKVKHTVFGVGTVTEVDDKYITVQFAAKSSKFAYPDAFEKFIKAENSAIQETILNDIVVARRAEEERRLAELADRKAEEERRAAERQTSSPAKKVKNIEDGFGADYNVEHLARQPILTYQQVEEQFGIRISGFGRGINKTPSTVVLISSVDKKKTGFVYHDHWTTAGEYIYSGEGKAGDQTMSSGNTAIVNAVEEGKDIHLFVKFSPQEYYYQSVFELVEYTYEDDLDENGNTRKEYKFRLRKADRGADFD